MTKSRNRRNNEKRSAWENAKMCDCNEFECSEKHKICKLCDEIMHFDVWQYSMSDLPHKYAWNKDHITDIWKGGTNKKSNLIATHPWCNNDKSNKS